MVGSLGYVVVPAAGTPVRATTNRVAPGTAADRIAAQTVRFQARAGNTGAMYIGTQGMVKASGANVLAVIPAPVSATQGPFADYTVTVYGASAGLNVADFYVDADVNGNGVVVSYTAQ